MPLPPLPHDLDIEDNYSSITEIDISLIVLATHWPRRAPTVFICYDLIPSQLTPVFQQTPVTKPPKTPKAVNLTLCSFDADEHKVELELSQTRVGKIVKFQFGVMDNETEEIAQQLVGV